MATSTRVFLVFLAALFLSSNLSAQLKTLYQNIWKEGTAKEHGLKSLVVRANESNRWTNDSICKFEFARDGNLISNYFFDSYSRVVVQEKSESF